MAVNVVVVFVGSSPRVRGTLNKPFLCLRLRRFIPASAGNALGACAVAAVGAVHPRECGERVGISTDVEELDGSSPRVRGTQIDNMRAKARERFIPASAGNAAGHDAPGEGHAVHPRECGERTNVVVVAGSTAGSSPRVRGTPRRQRRLPARHRFIPASAGNARVANGKRLTTPVHPRECGERCDDTSDGAPPAGSSPRVRGTPCGVHRALGRRRFIPASAGNASLRSRSRI